ncbi:MAG TPA: hypothetical protein VF766_02965 [Pyrinomonadaceae bacterium]
MSKALSLIFITLTLTQISEAADWRGIAPLRSTRADVERLLGPPEQGSSNVYQTASERISVSYSERACDYGWQVPAGTVISLSVYPKTPPPFAGLKLDERNFVKRTDPHIESLQYYVNQDAGINYTVDAGRGVVTGIEYYPSAKDNNRQCSPLMGSTVTTKDASKFDEYVGDSADEKKKLDDFAALLRQDAAKQGYVMVYAGRRSRLNEAETRAGRIKNYLLRTRGLSARQIVTINGGHREHAAVELYLAPRGATPPSSAPTLKPEEVQIIESRGKRRRGARKS